MNKFESEIFKRNRPGKPYTEEATHIEGCVKPNIQEKYNLNTKTSPVDYDNIVLPLKIYIPDKK